MKKAVFLITLVIFIVYGTQAQDENQKLFFEDTIEVPGQSCEYLSRIVKEWYLDKLVWFDEVAELSMGDCEGISAKRVFRFFAPEIKKQFEFLTVVPEIEIAHVKGYIWYRVSISIWDGGVSYRLDNFVHDKYGVVHVSEAYVVKSSADQKNQNKRFISHFLNSMMVNILYGLKKELTGE